MENMANTFDGLLNKTAEYLETRVELLLLKTASKTSDIISSLVSKIIMVGIGCMIVILINIGLAIWLGTIFNKMYLGFFAVGVFYILVILILFLGRDNIIKKPIKDSLIKSFLK